MIDLALSVACSLTIGMIFKHAGRQGLDRLALLTVNYAAALLVAGALTTAGWESAPPFAWEPGLAALGLVTGALFILGFFMLSLATDVAGMSLATAVMRVSVVIPFLASWWVWGERPSTAQGLGLALAGVAFFLIARRRGANGGAGAAAGRRRDDGDALRVLLVLALLFVVGGLVDVCMKTFDELFAPAFGRSLFLLMVFAVSALIGLGFVVTQGVRTGRWPRGRTLAWGVALGLANYGSAAFFLRAIEALSGPFVFPANNIALVIGGALLGVFVWGEQLSRLNWLGLGLAAAALVLLNL